MFTIEQSPFLHALGYAIGHSLWQISLLWLVYTAIIYLHRWTSSQRYNLALTTAISGFAWFIVTLVYYNNNITLTEENGLLASAPASEKLFSPEGKFVFFYHSTMATLRSLAPYFSCAYLFVMMLLSIRLANGFNEVKKLRTQGLSKASVTWRLFVKEHASLLGIKKPVMLHISNIAASPLTIGFWKPFILIPLASINQLTPQQLEAVLLHELAHIRRNDYIVNIVLQLAEITLFFNPFMRLLLNQARLERENSCDDYVLQFQYNATDYAKALLAIEQHSVGSILALGTNNQNEFQLLNRIKRMLAPERKAFNYRQQLGLLFLITLLGLGFTVISPRQQEQKTATTKQEVKENKITSVSGVEKLSPPAIDLVKNLEDIRQDLKKPDAISMEKTKKMEAAIGNATTYLEKQMQPRIHEIETAALEIEKLTKSPNFSPEALQMSAMKLKELGNVDWRKFITPAINEAAKVYAFPENFSKQQWPQVFFRLSPSALSAKEKQQMAEAKQLKQVTRLQGKLMNEQQQIMRLAEMEQIIQDSIQLAFSSAKSAIAFTNAEAVARARKQAAIAPFRQREVPTTYGPAPVIENYQFNYSNNIAPADDAEEEDDDDNSNTVKIYNVDRNKNQPSENCGCPLKGKTHVKAVLNGKAFSERVRRVWAEAQDQKEKGWTDEMQQKVVSEIEKELKNIDRIEVKTHVTTTPGNNKTIVIEVQTM